MDAAAPAFAVLISTSSNSTATRFDEEKRHMATQILVVGSGGREHALAWRLQVGEGTTPKADRVVVLAPGNPGAARDVECVPCAQTPAAIVALAKERGADLVVIGPEQPLVDGVIDALQAAKIPCVGPVAAAAALEGSKAFMKDLCRDAGVATAAYAVVETLAEVDAFLDARRAAGDTRLVVKADGLCAGKGVTVCDSLQAARREAVAFLGEGQDGKFGAASKRVVLEEFLEGTELSVFGLCDGTRAHLLATARDHKHLLDDDEGPNTGGMGAIAPLGHAEDITRDFLDRVQRDVFDKTLRALAGRGAPYRGILYAGLMVHRGAIRLLEFNVRLGDPEAQALLFGTARDFLPTFLAIGRGEPLGDDDGTLAACAPVACVVMASEGYPEQPQTGRPIRGLDAVGAHPAAKVFFAGVRTENAALVTSGGRVLAVCATGETHRDAIAAAYAAVAEISFDGHHLRHDVGQSVLL